MALLRAFKRLRWVETMRVSEGFPNGTLCHQFCGTMVNLGPFEA